MLGSSFVGSVAPEGGAVVVVAVVVVVSVVVVLLLGVDPVSYLLKVAKGFRELVTVAGCSAMNAFHSLVLRLFSLVIEMSPIA